MSFFGGSNALASSTPTKPASNLFGQTSFGFGATTTTAAPTLGFGGFNTNTATSSAPLGGFGGFGAGTSSAAPTLFAGTGLTTTSAPSTGFGFGANTTTSSAPPAFGFGATPATATSAGFSAFGSGAATSTTSTAPTFGGFGAASSGFGAFGSSFGKPAASTVTPGFGGFGGATSFMLGQPQQQVPQITPDEAFSQSIFNVSIYGDERDTIIAKWNYLQAMWGTGKSFYSQNAAPVEITPHNFFCRLKAIGYCHLPGQDNKKGLVALNFNKPLSDVRAQKQQIINSLNLIFGNKPHLVINIESEREHDDKKSQIVIYIEERSQFAPTETNRILATEVTAYLHQSNVKPQLNNLGIYEVLALVLPDEDQLKAYLENPPKGIDPRMWRQAKIDNPDPSKFLPVPMVGFNDLKQRITCQENGTEMQALFLKRLERELAELRQKHVASTSKIKEHKRQLAELSHRILKIIVKQECSRKVGLALTPEEETLRTKLENMQALVSSPNQFRGRLSELLSQMRMQRNQYAPTAESEYTIDKDCEDEMKQFLAMQQKAMEVLTETVTKDMKALQIILEGMPKLIQS